MVGDQILDPLGFFQIREVNDPLNLRHFLETRLGCPPPLPQIPDPLPRRRQNHLVGSSKDRPPLLHIEIGKSIGVFPLPHVPGHYRHPNAEVAGEIRKYETRVRRR